MQDIIFLEPVFQERIWGGTKLKEVFNYDIPSNYTGECWAISAHKHGDCKIKNGPFKGKTLSEVYEKHRYLFNHIEHPVFPLLTKILDANDDLSVQVHPDDAYALQHVGEQGKTECWYVLDCEPDSEIIFGHNAKTKRELRQLIEHNEWDKLLRRVKIKKGDFFYVQAGTIHALCKGSLILETQQSADTTYRLYDYHRLDQNGNLRPLHVEEAIAVTTVPHIDYPLTIKVEKHHNHQITTFVSDKYFTVQKWDIDGLVNKENDTFLLVSVINGEGKINDEIIKKGDHFIITSFMKEINLNGKLELIVSFL